MQEELLEIPSEVRKPVDLSRLGAILRQQNEEMQLIRKLLESMDSRMEEIREIAETQATSFGRKDG
jgi:hypothetical protein